MSKAEAERAPEKLDILNIERKASTLVKVKVKRLEAKREGHQGSQDVLRKRSSQISIKDFLESRKTIAMGQDPSTAKLEVRASLKPDTNLQLQGRATLGAHGVFGKAGRSSPLPGTPTKEGWEVLGRSKGQNKGCRPL